MPVLCRDQTKPSHFQSDVDVVSMSDSVIKVGDTVMLNSGGPLMTVTEVTVDPDIGVTVTCRWFRGEEIQTDDFPQNSLFRRRRSAWRRDPGMDRAA